MPTIEHLPISEMQELPGNATLDQILSLQSKLGASNSAILHSWKKGNKGVFFLVMTKKATAIRAMEGICGDIRKCQLLEQGPAMVRNYRKKLKSRRATSSSSAA